MTPLSHPFATYLELLELYLARRAEIVALIEQLLNSQGKSLQSPLDKALLSGQFHECFCAAGTLARAQPSPGQLLELAHWASGFKPRDKPGNDIVDPVEMLLRGLHMWRQTRWPGQKGRVRYAHILFNLSLLRSLALLTLRLWDGDADSAAGRLAQLQGVLDRLWNETPADQPRLVRAIHWLVPVAMSPTTDQLSGYFEMMAAMAGSFPAADLIEVHKAGVQTGAGHLRSQLYHLALQKGLSLDEHALVLLTRKSNALDLALLVQGLVVLFEAYQRCLHSGDEEQRLALASAIIQGVSPDPELFLLRPDLLGPYSMIEHLFITTDASGQAVHTAMGQRHLSLLQDYAVLLKRLALPLQEDYQRCSPLAGAYSPYGVLYGFSSNLIELMALKASQHGVVTCFSMEDAFSNGEADKRAWVSGWRNLPHIKPEVIKQYEYPQHFVDAISARVEQALLNCVSAGEAKAIQTRGRLFVLPQDALPADAALAQVSELPLCHILSSDTRIVAGQKAEALDQGELLHCRLEGEYLVSYQTAAGWLAISKDVLTDILGTDRDVKIAGLPREAAEVLRLMCPDQVVLVPG